MIPEVENPQEAKSVCPDLPARHAFADPGRYFTQSPRRVHADFSSGTANIIYGSCIMQTIIQPAKMITAFLDQIRPGPNWCLAFSTFISKQVKILTVIKSITSSASYKHLQ